ncbi:hypothetical protein [[Clostridium] fimetarium]|uniref:Uncharacterized protein n=1 Tax=[Clostridium] fimetarium TaxID=99656 RepID=A0A1I0PZX1_9FIRM|nr:hypothetical protein [[Clostridium] fimetarium]SEW20030.1 hypothetical protein SAMN05421659_106167 [[Clostridium] fimetarium]
MDSIGLVISIISISIVAFSFAWQWKIKNTEKLKYSIFSYIFEFYAPCYMIDKLPTTADVINHILKFKSHKNIMKVKYLLIELNHEKKILATTDMDRSFERICWRPSIIL